MRAFMASTGIFLLTSGHSRATSAGHRVFAHEGTSRGSLR
jgi:hypothetical protein